MDKLKRGVSYEEFVGNHMVMMGDDLMMCDRTGKFDPQSMGETWNSCGMYLECPAVNEQFMDMTFLGMHPVENKFGLMYSYDVDRLLASFNFTKRNFTVRERLHKMVSLATNLFAETIVFGKMKAAIHAFYREHSSSMSNAELRLFRSLEDFTQLKMYRSHDV